jgi:hypothetical protein
MCTGGSSRPDVSEVEAVGRSGCEVCSVLVTLRALKFSPALSPVTIFEEICYGMLGPFATFWRFVVSQRGLTAAG